MTEPTLNEMVLVGDKPLMNYVMAVLTDLTERRTAYIKARGRNISKAVDVEQVLRRRFVQNAETVSIKTTTEHLIGKDPKGGENAPETEAYVSSILIKVVVP